MSTIFLQKILKSRKLMENHVIMGPQCLVWPINGRPPPENLKGNNRIYGPRTYIGTSKTSSECQI